MSNTPAPQLPPGWYPFPPDPTKEMFWNGKGWYDIPKASHAQTAAPQLPQSAKKGGKGCGIGCVALIAGVVIFAAVSSFMGSNSSDNSNGSVGEAVTYCEARVQDALKSPSTADFPFPKTTGSAPNFTVTGVVDSENSFGGTVRAEYQCLIEFDGKGGYYTTLNYLR